MLVVNVIGLLVQLYFLHIWMNLPASGFKLVTAQGLRISLRVTILLMIMALILSFPPLIQQMGLDPEGNVVFLAITSVSYVLCLGNLDGIISEMGFAAMIATVVMFFSPLVQLQAVITLKNSIFLNYNLSFVSLVNCIAWLGFGVAFISPLFLLMMMSDDEEERDARSSC